MDAVFLFVAKAFDIVWVDCLLNKLTLLNFPYYLVKTICPLCTVGRSKCPSKEPDPLVVLCGLAWLRAE